MMHDLPSLGKMLLVIGLVVAAAGVVLMFGGKGLLSWFGRLPGDFSWKGKSFEFHFPLATSILLSIVLSLLWFFMNRK